MHPPGKMASYNLRLRILALLLLSVVGGCAADPAARNAWLVSPGTRSIADTYTVVTPIQWSRKAHGSRLEVWSSRDPEGWEDELAFVSGLIPGEPLIANWRDTPSYRAAMTPAQVAQFVVDSHVFHGGHFGGTVEGAWPAPFGDIEGFRYEVGYMTKMGIDVHGFGAGAVKDGKLYLIYLTAVDPYFEQLRPVTEQIINSVNFSPQAK